MITTGDNHGGSCNQYHMSMCGLLYSIQVLSSTVANALKVQGRQDTSSTILFLEYINAFFDMLNVSNVISGKRKRKPSMEPYRDATDWRFTVSPS